MYGQQTGISAPYTGPLQAMSQLLRVFVSALPYGCLSLSANEQTDQPDKPNTGNCDIDGKIKLNISSRQEFFVSHDGPPERAMAVLYNS